MSKNTDLSSLINYVKGATSGRLTFPSYTSSSSFTGTIAGYLGFDSSGNILTTGSASQWATSGSNIYYNIGSVAIGTSTISPATNQTLFENYATNYATLRVNAGGTVKADINANNVGNFLFVGTTTNHPFLLGTNDSEKVRITPSDGDFLVGRTTRPYSGTGLRHISVHGTSRGIFSMTNDSSSSVGMMWYGSEQIDIYNTSTTGSIKVMANTGGVILGVNGTSWSSASDIRLKTDLIPIENSLNKVLSLRAYTGRYKNDSIGTSRSFLIAQDVQSVLPEAVSVNQEDGFLNLSYTDVIPLLVASIKELKSELDTLKEINS